ncbi:hypothetical protein B4080_3284 [Bacillus cereus]|nr:hypothetical protein B4080_3284 [Bacillus cereus]
MYEKDDQKALYEVATQKMIPLEVKRAGLNKRILTQQMRNKFMVRLIKQGS